MNNFKFFPKDIALKPITGFVIVDSYWFVHPEKGLCLINCHGFYSKQHNNNLLILDKLKKHKDYKDFVIEKLTTYWGNDSMHYLEKYLID